VKAQYRRTSKHNATQQMVKIDVIQATLRWMANELQDRGITIPGAKPTTLELPDPEISELMLPEQHHYIAKAEINTYWLADVADKHKNDLAYNVCISICGVEHNTQEMYRTLYPVYETICFHVYWVLTGIHHYWKHHYILLPIVQGLSLNMIESTSTTLFASISQAMTYSVAKTVSILENQDAM
jgi:hypothetical protein